MSDIVLIFLPVRDDGTDFWGYVLQNKMRGEYSGL